IASALDSDDIADAEPPTRGIDLPARAAPPARPAGNVSHGGARHRVEEGSADPIKPILVRTVSVKRGGAVSAAAPVRTASAGDDTAVSRSAPPTTRGGWIIQVGAFPEEGVARDRLKAVKSAAKSMLSSAEPFTMRVVVRDATLYRARFAGLDRTEAQAACKYLKRNEIACLAIKN
ncbi:SPOR domain-containing protein, partial [bacterium]|nr:SPOR domain-containing protein [bacterium]